MSYRFKTVKKIEAENRVVELSDGYENYYWLLINGGFDAKDMNRVIWEQISSNN